MWKHNRTVLASFILSAPTTKMWIHGREVESQATEFVDLRNPATNEVVTRVPKCTQAEMLAAVDRLVAMMQCPHQILRG